jgi:phage FluMu protein Com
MTKCKACKAIIEFGDDYGDNHSTFHCQLEAGHEGRHSEKGVMRENMPYTLTWEGTIEYVNIKCPVCGRRSKVEKEDWEWVQREGDGWTCLSHDEPEPLMVIDDE